MNPADIIHMPDFSGHYYSVQVSYRSNGAAFGYVGTRTKGTAADDHLVTGPNWKGQTPGGMTQIAHPNNAVLVIRRVLVMAQRHIDRI